LEELDVRVFIISFIYFLISSHVVLWSNVQICSNKPFVLYGAIFRAQCVAETRDQAVENSLLSIIVCCLELMKVDVLAGHHLDVMAVHLFLEFRFQVSCLIDGCLGEVDIKCVVHIFVSCFIEKTFSVELSKRHYRE
jgi:hypothetical protein